MNDRPTPSRPANRHRQDRRRGLLRLVPPVDPTAFVDPSEEAEQTALALIDEARNEAVEQGRKAAEHLEFAAVHAAKQAELLEFATQVGRVVWA
jgi:hypothetical protein